MASCRIIQYNHFKNFVLACIYISLLYKRSLAPFVKDYIRTPLNEIMRNLLLESTPLIGRRRKRERGACQLLVSYGGGGGAFLRSSPNTLRGEAEALRDDSDDPNNACACVGD